MRIRVVRGVDHEADTVGVNLALIGMQGRDRLMQRTDRPVERIAYPL
jgi:hypothetical protein